MEQNKFFIWLSRINSIFFLLLLISSIGLVLFGLFESNKWSQRNTVEVIDEESPFAIVEDLRLGRINKVCGRDIQYIKLNTKANSKGFSSGGYSTTTRNIVFFAGNNMDSHWLFESNNYLIEEINQLKKQADDCKDKETVSIYYEIVKSDSNKDGKLDNNDDITVALSSPDGTNYVEILSGLSSVIDHSIDSEAKELTILVQKGSNLLMQKFSLETNEKIAEREISKIGKKL